MWDYLVPALVGGAGVAALFISPQWLGFPKAKSGKEMAYNETGLRMLTAGMLISLAILMALPKLFGAQWVRLVCLLLSLVVAIVGFVVANRCAKPPRG